MTVVVVAVVLTALIFFFGIDLSHADFLTAGALMFCPPRMMKSAVRPTTRR